jgi:hypothetical protein
MVIDDGGALWLSNPWLASAVIVLAVALVAWCHRWLETGRMPAPRSVGVQAVRMTRRASRQRSDTERPILVAPSRRLVTRSVSSTRLPRSAA